ncbi:MAG: ribose 5-phosphate isomerase B [bacterium]
MVIALGSDHAGFALKEKIKEYLVNKGFEIKDFGTDKEESCDYPDYGFLVGDFVSKNKASLGILICGTGIGMSISANRISKVRAALCHTEDFARLARQHNHANILCLSGRFLKEDEGFKIVDAFLEAEPEKGRHKRRVEKLG